MTEYNIGDLVEAVKGESVIRGRLDDQLDLDPIGWDIPYFVQDGYTVTVVERAALTVELPTESGLYADDDGDAWLLSPTGKFIPLTDLSSRRIPTDVADALKAEDFVPFTRLESRAETAKAVIDSIRETEEFSIARLRCRLSGDMVTEGLLTVVDQAAAQFGVE